MGRIVEQIELFCCGTVTSLGEGKLMNFKPDILRYTNNIDIILHPACVERFANSYG